MKILQRAFVAGAIVWAVALPLATWAATRSHASSVTYALALMVYGVGSVVCHQLPERSFHLWGVQMPVCARCTGIYLGAAIVAAVCVARGVQPGARRSPQRLALLLALAPTLATLVFEWTTGRTPANWVRALAGALLGGVVAWVVVAAAQSARGPARK